MGRRNYATKEVRVGEVFVECAEKTEFPGFGFLRQAKTAPCGNRTRLPKKKTEPGGLKEGDWVYTGPMPGAKMEILADIIDPIVVQGRDYALPQVPGRSRF